ncbi:MAG: hypothetical protein KGJ97_00720 [Xanthomonadaceae bacterium]|nr:hypothetical protein [Xanthomonadaceae bacterium]MDE3071137.1 hypothetical protein [Pseudomonadota bacterium]
MTSQLCTLLAGCILATIFGTATARAATGRIAFSGAVVAPTCAAPIDVSTTVQPGQSQSSGRYVCGSAGAAADAGRSYSVTVASLGPSTTSDRLLNYFAGYVGAAGIGQANPKLVTQTYE